MNKPGTELEIGQILRLKNHGEFRVESRLGSGGMGVVYQIARIGENEGLRYAAKVIRSEYLAHPEMVERYRREAQIMNTLSHHENILRVHGLWWTEGHEPRPVIIMDLLKGNTLRAVMEKQQGEGDFPLYFVCSVAMQVLNALQEIHPRGLVHRDIKPENIFLHQRTKTCPVVLMDFGIVKKEGVAEASGMFLGSPGYAAPEQILGEEVTPKSDLYALSVVLYEMFAGRELFPGVTDPRDVALAHVERTPVHLRALRPDLPPPILNMIMRGLEKDPKDRPEDAFAFAAPFGEAWNTTMRTAGNSTMERIVSNTIANESLRPVAARTPHEGAFSRVESDLGKGQTLRLNTRAIPEWLATTTAPDVSPLFGSTQPGADPSVREVAASSAPPAIEAPTRAVGGPPGSEAVWRSPPGAEAMGAPTKRRETEEETSAPRVVITDQTSTRGLRAEPSSSLPLRDASRAERRPFSHGLSPWIALGMLLGILGTGGFWLSQRGRSEVTNTETPETSAPKAILVPPSLPDPAQTSSPPTPSVAASPPLAVSNESPAIPSEPPATPHPRTQQAPRPPTRTTSQAARIYINDGPSMMDLLDEGDEKRAAPASPPPSPASSSKRPSPPSPASSNDRSLDDLFESLPRSAASATQHTKPK